MKQTFLILGIFTICRLCQAQFTQPQVLSAGGEFFSNTTSSLSLTMGEPVIATFIGTDVILTQGFQQPWINARVSGKLSYNNTLNSPLVNANVFLKTFSGLKVDSAVTNSSGKFNMYHAGAGTYVFDISLTTAPGGFNSIDALQDLRHFVGLLSLTGMNFKAGDVNVSGNINSIDALLIAKRFVGIISTFIPGDWIIPRDTITLGPSGMVSHDLKTLCYGDNNASYVPGAKTSPVLFLSPKGEIQLQKNLTTVLPVFTKNRIEAGSFSIILHYPADMVSIENIEATTDKSHLLYRVSGDETRIAWFTTEHVVFNENETILNISLKAKNSSPLQGSSFFLTTAGESFISDPAGKIYPFTELFYPDIQISGDQGLVYLSGIYPNPLNTGEACFVDYFLPEDAAVRLSVCNPLGETITTGETIMQTAGSHIKKPEISGLSAGIYFIRFEAAGNNTSFKKVLRLVIGMR